MLLAFLTIVFIILEFHMYFLMQDELQKLKSSDKQQSQEWVKNNWIFTIVSMIYLGYTFYLIFTPYWATGTLLFLLAYAKRQLNRLFSKLTKIVLLFDFVGSVVILVWVLLKLLGVK